MVLMTMRIRGVLRRACGLSTRLSLSLTKGGSRRASEFWCVTVVSSVYTRVTSKSSRFRDSARFAFLRRVSTVQFLLARSTVSIARLIRADSNEDSQPACRRYLQARRRRWDHSDSRDCQAMRSTDGSPACQHRYAIQLRRSARRSSIPSSPLNDTQIQRSDRWRRSARSNPANGRTRTTRTTRLDDV